MKSLDPAWIASLPIPKLEAEIRHHNRLYFEKHAPEISDADFDKLVEALRQKDPTSKVLQEIGSDLGLKSERKKVIHTSPMLSLDKCYAFNDFKNWAEKFEGELIASPKIDGCAISVRYDKNGNLETAATRGDGFKGEDITQNVFFVENIPTKIRLDNGHLPNEETLEVRGEVYMPLSTFSEFKEKFANPRNLTAGAIKQKKAEETKKYRLKFFAYDLIGKTLEYEAEKAPFLKQLGFEPAPSETVTKDEKSVLNLFQKWMKHRPTLDYEIDGVVFKANLISEQKRLGASNHHPRSAIAYKFEGDSGVTTLREVEWNVSRSGAITPVGIVDPVELSGATVSRVSMHNLGWMQKLRVRVPSKIMLVRRGGVIPHLESVLEASGKPVEIPALCPSCEAKTEIRDDFLYCSARENCQQSKIAELKHFVEVAEIEGLGEVWIQKFYQEGLVEDAADFYTLKLGDLLGFERMGEKLAQKILDHIEIRRRLPLAAFLATLSIPELAGQASKILASHFLTLDLILELDENDICSIHGFGRKMARQIVNGLKIKRPLIQKLLKQIEVIPDQKPLNVSKKENDFFFGKNFLFTGKMTAMPRNEAEKKVEALGGNIAASVSESLDFLVIGSEGYRNQEKGSKWIKAEKLITKGAKLKILTEEEFLEKLVQNK